jgi:rhodanese-related sulfurtransferase
MVEELSPEAVKERIEEGETQVVDIRPPEQFERGHIPGAINIPLSQLPASVADVEWGDDVVCACPVGQSSVQAAKLIQSFEEVDDDATVASMAGGYREWEYELEDGETPGPQ